MRGTRILRRAAVTLTALLILAAVLFCANGLWPSWKTPSSGRLAFAPERAAGELRVVAYNIAKCFAHGGGLAFRPAAEVERCLDRQAAVLERARPQLVFLSEINLEGGPVRVDQVRYLARKLRMHAWAFGENYSFGLPLPFLRLRSGNAVLSRFPLKAVATQQLPHGTPFYRPMGNRRILWADVDLGGRWLRVGALRNDSFDFGRNLDQVRFLLRELGAREALLAGDFNATPGSPPMEAWRRSGRFSGAFAGPPTFPADRPTRTIDYILAPRAFRLLRHEVLQSDASDHRPVVSVFAVPTRGP